MAKLQRERAEKVAVFALVVQLVVGVLAFVAARVAAPGGVTWVAAVPAVAWYLVIGVGFWLMAWLHLRQSRLAESEAEEWQRLLGERETRGARGALFEADEISAQVDRNRLRIMERYVLPGAGLVLLLALGLAALFLRPSALAVVTKENAKEVIASGRCMQAAVLMLVSALGTFLLGMYASGMARYPEWSALRAGAGYMMSCAIVSILAAVGLALAQFEIYLILNFLAWFTPALMAVVAVEVFLSFVLDLYRPRMEGVVYRPCYESRILSMLTEPGGVLRTVAATLDYQFGFKVSETWFYRFLERAILPLILFGVVAYYAMTCIVIVGPDQEVIFERFGRPVHGADGRAVFGSGLYFKWPWPVTNAYQLDTKRIRQMDIGYVADEKERKDMAEDKQREFLWTQEHHGHEYVVMVATKRTAEDRRITEDERAAPGDQAGKREALVPVGLIVAVANILYDIDDYEKYLYKASNPDGVLEALAYREQQRYFAGVDFYAAMGRDRETVARELRQNIQAAAREVNLGIRIVRVCLHETHPPIKDELGQTFEKAVAAKQQKQSEIYAGETYAKEVLVATRFRAQSKLAKAHAERIIERERALGEATRYQQQLVAYEAGRLVYRMSEYLDAFVQHIASSKARKYFVAAQDIDIEVLNLDVKDELGFDPSRVDLTGD